MQKQGDFLPGDHPSPTKTDERFAGALVQLNFSRKLVAGIILLVALVAFELFNFDSTRYALQSLLGEVSFAGVKWATILAVAFCAIDFAGLTRLFTPERGRQEPTAVWYLMGAWLIAATMNAIMTWWAVSLTLLSHDLGNEVLAREQLLRWVPFFVATLVWLTRILFIGAFSVAGEYIFDLRELRRSSGQTQRSQSATAVPSRPYTPPLASGQRAPRPAMSAQPKEPAPPEARPSTNYPPRPGQQRPSGMQARPRR
jgi:hypothetical protein